jgi:hypothetical protein
MLIRHRTLHLFDNATSTLLDNDHHQDQVETWDTKASILLFQGLFITFLVVVVLCACGRKHYRSMNILRLQEMTTIRIEQMNRDDGREEEPRTGLQHVLHVLAAPLRYVDSLVNAWASSPSTDFEYYNRILQRIEREKEARREGVEERTKRLMNAFMKAQCLWVSLK